MFSKILQKTKNKPCSCPSGKICASCKSKKVNRPHVSVKEPRRSNAPVSSRYYNHLKSIYQNSPTVQYLNPKTNKIRKREQNDSSLPKCFNFCRRYKRRKALKEPIKAKKEEEAREKKKKRENFEKERMKDFIAWERAKQRTPPRSNTVRVKDRAAGARPAAPPQTLNPKNSLSNRFVNYCYRLCCRLCCCLGCVALAALGVIYFA